MALAAATASAPGYAEEESPLLREQIKVHGDLVTLGDLFENAGAAATVPVFRAPDLGNRGIVSASRVVAAARQHGLEWANPGGIAEVVVQRPSRVVSLEEITELIARHAAREDGDTADSWSVFLKRGSKPLHLDPRITGPVTVKHFELKTRSGAFRATVGVQNAEQSVPDRVYSGRAHRTIKVAVPAHPIDRETVIRKSDLELIRMPVSSVPAGVLEDPGEIVGMAARQRLTPNRPLRRSDLEEPKLVRRNALVTIVYRAPGLVLKSKGRALADASEGEEVAIVNVQSKRTLHARVTGAGVVSVSSTPANAPSSGNSSSRGSADGGNSYVIR